MTKLILVKHAAPQIEPAVVAHRWVLSDAGRASCAWLAGRLADHSLGAIYSSLEPKALETAALASLSLRLDIRPREGLGENDRTGLPFGDIASLEEKISRFFSNRDLLVMGKETANEAAGRFEAAVANILDGQPGRDVAVVTHGSVLTSFVSRHNDLDPFDFWIGLSTPSCVILDAEGFHLLEPPQVWSS